MSEIRNTTSDVEATTDTDRKIAARQSSLPSSIGVYDRPAGARSAANNSMFLILLVLVILILAFLAYRWWF